METTRSQRKRRVWKQARVDGDMLDEEAIERVSRSLVTMLPEAVSDRSKLFRLL
jgi:hypothetical protein